MSLLKWKEIAKRKTNLGNKINFVHDAILKNKMEEQIDQAAYQKIFKPITSKLDDVVSSNLKLPAFKRGNKKRKVPDYGISAGDDEDILIMDWMICLMRKKFHHKITNN